jgi:ABC-type sugar transport system substrate-binding protein
MKHRTILSAISLALTSVTALAACSTASTGGGTSANGSTSTLQIGGVVPTASDPFFVTLMCGATQEARAEGASMVWKPTTNTSTEQLQSNLNAVSLNSKAGIILSGTGDSSFNAKVQTQQQAGTPVAVVNAPIVPAIEYASFVTTTNNTSFASYVANDIGHSGSIGILGAIPGIPALATRYTPMVADLKIVAPNVTILPVQYDNLDPTIAASDTSALIAAQPDLKAIYAVSGPEGTGAAAAVAQAGKTEQIKIYTYDATPEIVQDLQNGTIRAALAQSPYEMGADAVKTILAYTKDHKSSQPVTQDPGMSKTMPLKILTQSNVNAASSKPFEYQSTCK